MSEVRAKKETVKLSYGLLAVAVWGAGLYFTQDYIALVFESVFSLKLTGDDIAIVFVIGSIVMYKIVFKRVDNKYDSKLE